MERTKQSHSENPDFKEIQVELSKESFYKIAVLAHDLDITFNQMCNKIVREEIERLKVVP